MKAESSRPNTPDESSNRKPDSPPTFTGLGLGQEALDAVERAGFYGPTEIQEKFIPAALTGRDSIGRARTGTGKTAAFLLPLFHRFFSGEPVRMLVLAPTRELAEQIKQESRKLSGKNLPRVLAAYGGTRLFPQIEELKEKPEIVVGTPGRLMDLGQRKALDFGDFRIVVLDEVDRMFDMGFRQDIARILGQCRKREQTLFLSATLPPEIMRLAERYLKNPLRISAVEEESPSVESLEQAYFIISPRRKRSLLERLLEREKPDLALIFVRTKRGVERLGKALDKKYRSTFVHGDLSQKERDRAVNRFREGKVKILVATDLMGRGIDVPGITHIINYDIPEYPEDYLHRVGRAARMEAKGKAFTFVTPEQGEALTKIEILCNLMLPEDRIENFDTGLEEES
ncbi:MAG: DEAD/DEAH box helicase [Candidatus Erginobacter occultus]|nr:DEAD/DEAH box helicase [Candidatus Erginobacter occultus]